MSAAVVLALAACGGGDDEADEPASDPSSAPADEPVDDGEPAADDGGDEAAADGDDGDDDQGGSDDATESEAATGSGFDFGTGVARVTVGDRDYEFDLTTGFTVCQDVFDGLQVAGQSTSGEANVDMWIPPPDWESYSDGRYDPPAITLEDDELNTRWIADPNRVELLPDWPPESKVDSYEKDGNAASGSATFVDDYAPDAAPVSGSFEVACQE